MTDESTQELNCCEIARWAEFCAWAALTMTAIIWRLQGPSVSTDQFVVRTSLVMIAAVIGVGLRIFALCRRRRTVARPGQKVATDDVGERPPNDKIGKLSKDE